MLFQFYPYGTSGPFQSVFQTLVNWGILDAIFPFIIMYVLLFVTFGKIELLKKNATLLSLIISLMILVPHVLRLYPPQQDPFIMMSTIAPSLAIIMMALFMLFILMGFVGGVPNVITTLVSFAGVLLLLGIILGTVFPAITPIWFGNLLIDPNVVALAIILVVMALVVYFVAGDSAGDKKDDKGAAPAGGSGWADKVKNFSESLKKLMGD